MGVKLPERHRPAGLGRHFARYFTDPHVNVEVPGRDRPKKRNFSWSHRDLARAPSFDSITATVSDSIDQPWADGYHPSVSSGYYTGHNSAIYSSYFSNGPLSQLHALADAACSPLIWDVRIAPKALSISRLMSHTYGPHALSFPLTSSGAAHVRIVSEDFPWTIQIGPKSRAITVSDALLAIYDLLQKDLDEAVWALSDEETRASINRARRRRSETAEKCKNVDWLGRRYMFKGFYRDRNFSVRRLQPGAMDVAETFVVAFMK